jgi:hypothetical protein
VSASDEASSARWRSRLLVGLASLSLALAAALAGIWAGWIPSPRAPLASATLLADPALRDEVVRRLAQENPGLHEAHLDPEVGRVLRPDMTVDFKGVEVRTNSHGMREDAYDIAKPEGVVRVVLLGDSYVFGQGTLQSERFGVFLREALRTRARQASAVECLHLGVSSWNILSECAYLRRQLDPMRPDLVVHVVVPNDLGDTAAVRGIGTLAAFSSQHRERAGGMIDSYAPRHQAGVPTENLLHLGLDHESRSRFEAAAQAITRLAGSVEERGGRYLLLILGGPWLPVARERLAAGLDPDQVAFLSSEFVIDPRFVVGGGNMHWNRAGNERVAELLYGLIARRGLLPALELAPWPEADVAVEEIHAPGQREARRKPFVPRELLEDPQHAQLDFARFSETNAWHVYGGIDEQGRICPYASLMLVRPGASALRVQARELGRSELAGARVRVFVEEFEVGALELAGEGEHDVRFPLPEATRERACLGIRFESDDFVYSEDFWHPCVVLELRRVALE